MEQIYRWFITDIYEDSVDMLLYCREYEDDDDEDMSEEECLKKSSDDTYSLQYTVQLTIIFDKETCGT